MSKGTRYRHGKPGRGILPGVIVGVVLAAAVVAGFFLWKQFGQGDAPLSVETSRPKASLAPVSSAPEGTPSLPLAQDPTPAPTPAPTPTPGREAGILASMSLHEKLCQLFMVQPSAITGVETVTQAGEMTRTALEEYPVGGFLYNSSNMLSQEQVREMLDTTQSFVKIPLLFACDEEGGRVNRLMESVGTTWVGPMLDYQDQGPQTARANAETIARDMKSCGFNLDFAPVADVWSNPENTVIGDRAYSDDFSQAAELIPAAVQGFHSGGVACTLKHFPGHGDTYEDTHYGSAHVGKSLDELRQQELVPFKAGIDAGADVVMIGHLIVDDVSDEPALFSQELVTGLLREEMGFNGVVVTDGLEMQAVADNWSSGEIAVKAISAGVDLLLCPTDLQGALDALTQAVETGEIPEERIDESVLRILTFKSTWGLLP